MWFERYESMLSRGRREPADVVVATALRDRLRQPSDALDEPLRASLGVLCSDARERGAGPENLILEVKRIWRDVVAQRPAADASRRQELLAHAVTFCIEEYYRTTKS